MKFDELNWSNLTYHTFQNTFCRVQKSDRDRERPLFLFLTEVLAPNITNHSKKKEAAPVTCEPCFCEHTAFLWLPCCFLRRTKTKRHCLPVHHPLAGAFICLASTVFYQQPLFSFVFWSVGTIFKSVFHLMWRPSSQQRYTSSWQVFASLTNDSVLFFHWSEDVRRRFDCVSKKPGKQVIRNSCSAGEIKLTEHLWDWLHLKVIQ